MMGMLEKEFESKEHDTLGSIELKGMATDLKLFTFPSGVTLRYGEIILLAGDYFGVGLQPISLAMGEANKKKRFLNAYQQLANCPPEKIYNALKTVEDGQATNGLTFQNIEGDYLLLAVHNIDHFGDYAIDAFSTGYALAMEAAVLAGKMQDPAEKQKQMAYAYSLLGFASHFLTDRFASGHMRTPRLELDHMFSPELGALLSFFQHNEDGDMGLEVESEGMLDKVDSHIQQKGLKTWTAYGDGHLEDDNNKICKERVLLAVQTAANDIYHASITQVPTLISESAVLGMIPKVTQNNHPPMFKVDDGGRLLCRVPVNTISDNYAPMSRKKAIEILLYHGEKYVEKVIKDKIKSFVKYLEAQEKKFVAQVKSISRYSLFSSCSSPRAAKQAENKQNENRAQR